MTVDEAIAKLTKERDEQVIRQVAEPTSFGDEEDSADVVSEY